MKIFVVCDVTVTVKLVCLLTLLYQLRLVQNYSHLQGITSKEVNILFVNL